MSIHGVLSESSVSRHGGLTHGSGREVEGKWKGSGRRVVTSHHLVTSVTRDLAPVVAPSPVAAPDEMMSLAAIEHLDFEPSCDVPGCERPAGIVVEVLPHLTHIAKSARAGRRHTPCLPCWRRIIAPQAALCGCGMVVGWRDLWKIVEVLR